MNGRVYDYNLGRFMSVDPLIHSEGGSQGINPYSYIMNNPLAGVDPTGYDPEKETIEVSKDAKVYEDSDGNKYVDAGDGSGDMIKMDSISTTKSGGTTVTAGFQNGSVTSLSATKGSATVSLTDIGGPQQTATVSIAGQSSGSADSSSNEGGLIDDISGAAESVFGESGGGPSFWGEFKKVAEMRLEQVTDAADYAVDYWVARDNPIMGTLAATMTKDNIGNTTFTLATTAFGGSLAGGIRQSYVNSMKELSAFRARLIAKGYSEKNIARMLVRARNMIKDKFRGFKSNYHRPSYKKLSQTKSDARIIENATKTNPGVNRMLGAK